MDAGYGMIEGIANNGDRRKDEEEKKSSLMEKLQENKKEATRWTSAGLSSKSGIRTAIQNCVNEIYFEIKRALLRI